jgi:hypothetical protein
LQEFLEERERDREREREKHSPNKRIIQHKKKKVGWVDVQEGKTDAEGYLRDPNLFGCK